MSGLVFRGIFWAATKEIANLAEKGPSSELLWTNVE